jgi:CheY-like chemotaxis protein
VLVIDDEPSIAKAIRRVLSADHDVVGVTSASAALVEIERGTPFDLILCDLMMPVMTGMELHEELSRRSPELAGGVVFLTGGAFTAQARQFLDRVPNERIEKPFDVDTLRALVDRRIG